ncbi:MAG: glycosyltransferase family 39 protein, partial [Megasphaera sp.]
RDLLPGDISWNAKNVMPFMAIEDLPNHDKVLALVNDQDEAHFLQDVPGKWKWVGQKGVWVVYEKESDL